MLPVGVVNRNDLKSLYSVLALEIVICVNAVVLFYLSAVLEKRKARDERELTAVTMPPALAEGFETLLIYALMLAVPQQYAVAVIHMFTGMIAVSIAQRMAWAYRHL